MPKYIREAYGRGFSLRKTRKMVHRWPYRQFADMLALKTAEFKGFGVIIGEYRSTKMCSACRMNKCRHCRQHRYANTTIADRKFHCRCCGLDTDRDANAAKNIALNGLKAQLVGAHNSHGAVGVNASPRTGDEELKEPRKLQVGPEPRSARLRLGSQH